MHLLVARNWLPEMIKTPENPNVPKRSIHVLVAIAGLVLVAACSGSRAEGAQDLAADAIYAGGDIVTLSDAQPTAEALAVKDGRILAVGARSAIEASYKGEDTTIVELGRQDLAAADSSILTATTSARFPWPTR